MSIQSKPATQHSRDGHSRVFGSVDHINAACCECIKCLERKSGKSRFIGQYVLGYDLANDAKDYTVRRV